MRDAIIRFLDRIGYAPVVTLTPFVRWYDIWIGVYVDTKNCAVYICPLPMIGVKIVWRMEKV